MIMYGRIVPSSISVASLLKFRTKISDAFTASSWEGNVSKLRYSIAQLGELIMKVNFLPDGEDLMSTLGRETLIDDLLVSMVIFESGIVLLTPSIKF
jgi:hypothetical protein